MLPESGDRGVNQFIENRQGFLHSSGGVAPTRLKAHELQVKLNFRRVRLGERSQRLEL